MDEAPSRRIPNLLHVLLFLALTIGLYLIVELVAVALLRQPAQKTLVDEKIGLVVTAITYALVLLAAGVLFPAVWGRTFRDGIQWNGAGGKLLFGLGGLLLGFAAEAVDRFLPTPHEMPIEDVFRTPGIIWLLALFGTVLAPLFEEVVFRGLLLPALGNAVEWLRLPSARTEETDRMHAEWRQSDGISTASAVVASLLTSVLFALIHAPQLGFNWAPVGLLMCVSLVLCWVRLRTKSVAASTLVHGCYNLAAFLLIFVATGGFRHMDLQ